MAKINIDNQTYHIDGILFDKDGTLINFRSLWVTWADKLIDNIVSAAQLSAKDKEALAHSIGFDVNSEKWDPKGPLCIGSLDDLIAILSFHLYQKGMPWNEAVEIVINTYGKVDKNHRWDKEIQSITGLRHFLNQAKECDIKLGVITSDNHDQAVQHLNALQLDSYFGSVIGHDQVERGKPFPDMAELACHQLGIRLDQTIVVGDSDGDMILGKKVNAVASVGIVTEPSIGADHLINADHIIRSYQDIIINKN
ncbi:haloacid dehalogenase [Bacillus sp. J14TS2]|uniref:HAD family hydrolase n=1 Tax=Bacillus sp. J14TS2 TaxID=2807188 RepID=UPI001B2747E9|nr:HAD family hydrolase [Bacillus sp. J14TS2]GIN72520.1 haloacid dehalogenase [Bacillus sp. J14TS2]